MLGLLLLSMNAGPWVVLALLGAYHSLNPAMGWLFALALGLQEKRRAAVVRALVPIALGHAVAVGIALLLLSVFQRLFPTHSCDSRSQLSFSRSASIDDSMQVILAAPACLSEEVTCSCGPS